MGWMVGWGVVVGDCRMVRSGSNCVQNLLRSLSDVLHHCLVLVLQLLEVVANLLFQLDQCWVGQESILLLVVLHRVPADVHHVLLLPPRSLSWLQLFLWFYSQGPQQPSEGKHEFFDMTCSLPSNCMKEILNKSGGHADLKQIKSVMVLGLSGEKNVDTIAPF